MYPALPVIRWTTVIALIASLGAYPDCAPSLRAACMRVAARSLNVKCCCGTKCNCPKCFSHRQPANDQKSSRSNLPAAYQLAKIVYPVGNIGISPAVNSHSLGPFWLSLESRIIPTLITQHTCLQV